ncbi:MAG: lysophospholipid acyltransferase family protein [Bacteroidia bacterium]
MKGLIFRLQQFWAIWFLVLFAITFLVQYPLYAILLRIPALYSWVHRIRVGWAWLLFACIGLRLQVQRQHKLSRNAPYIYVANHASFLDIPVMAAAVPGTLHFMAKHELAKIPLFGLFFRTIDIAVPRGQIRGSHRAYEAAAQRLKQGGNIMIFPEGGILPNAPTLKAFKSGAFRLAIAHNIPIVPVSLIDNWRILPDAPVPPLRPGKSRVVVHAPIHPQALGGDENELRRLTHQIINNTLIAAHEN